MQPKGEASGSSIYCRAAGPLAVCLPALPLPRFMSLYSFLVSEEADALADAAAGSSAGAACGCAWTSVCSLASVGGGVSLLFLLRDFEELVAVNEGSDGGWKTPNVSFQKPCGAIRCGRSEGSAGWRVADELL